MMKKMKVMPSNVYLIEINKPIAYMDMDKYIQEATKGPSERFYINLGSAGHISISSKSVTILAQNIYFSETFK
jgi:F0F1-type ATP synthase epsilon subunit